MGLKRRQRLKLYLGTFQLRFIAGILMLSLIVSLGLAYKVYQLEVEKNKILDIQNEVVSELIQRFDQNLFLIVLMVVVLQAMVLVFLILYMTHKVSGPIYRIQKDLEKAIETGVMMDMSPVRKNDEFQDFFKALKTYIDTYQKK